jgi:hypothetical protein
MATTNTATHAARVAHFVQRPHGIPAMLRIRFSPPRPSSAGC